MKKLFAIMLLCLLACGLGFGQTKIQESFFGAGFNGGNPWPPTDGQHQIATFAGLRLWDSGVKWAQIETAPGVYDWAKMDAWISKAQGQQVDVLYAFGSTPAFAGTIPAGNPCAASQGHYSCSSPKDINSDGTGTNKYFSDFVTALVTRYKGRIAFYELWNEMDCKNFWSGNTAQAVRMTKDAAAIIRKIDPAAKILSPSAHGPTMAGWWDGYIGAGGAANFDIVNVHMRGQNGTNASAEAFLTVYGQVITELQKRNLTSLPLWDDEHGINPADNLTDPDELAAYAARSVVLRAGVRLQRQYIYTWDKNMQGKDAGTAWDVTAGWLIGHTISPCVAKGTIYTCTLDNGLIVWDASKKCSNSNCGSTPYTYASTYKFQTDIDGRKTSLQAKTVTIGSKPILLTAK